MKVCFDGPNDWSPKISLTVASSIPSTFDKACFSAEHRTHAVRADVGRESDVVRLFEVTDRDLGRVTALVVKGSVRRQAKRT
jgi:NAD(P)-dependent dehydrogenase (short-subunit alcohol dehydrogenase family)